jgi:hypothetical protein
MYNHLPPTTIPSYLYITIKLCLKKVNIVLSLGKGFTLLVLKIISKGLAALESIPNINYFECAKG